MAGPSLRCWGRHQQEVLGREDPPRQFYVLNQGAIQRSVGGPGHPGIMRRQLRYLAGVAARPDVTIEVVPFAAGAHPGMNGPFSSPRRSAGSGRTTASEGARNWMHQADADESDSGDRLSGGEAKETR